MTDGESHVANSGYHLYNRFKHYLTFSCSVALCVAVLVMLGAFPQFAAANIEQSQRRSDEDITGKEFVIAYLRRYGYIDKETVNPGSAEVSEGIKRLRKELGYRIDSNADSELRYLMRLPRCSKQEMTQARQRRFVPHKKRWRYTDLTWRLRDPFGLFKFKSDLTLVREVITEGFRLWSKATRGALELRDDTDDKAKADADLDIFFALKDHGDHEPFDGIGGIVAHTGYPMEGKMHFDGAELWTLNSDTGIDFRYVALHEIGHALGLRHSHHNGSVMFPIYRRAGGMGELGLHRDDVRGIQYLYPLSKRRYLASRLKRPKPRKRIPGGYAAKIDDQKKSSAFRKRRHKRQSVNLRLRKVARRSSYL